MTKEEEYGHLLDRSKRFYETAIFQLQKGYYDLSASSLEQSLQLFLKAMIVRLGYDYPRTHSIRRLLEIIREITGLDEIARLETRYEVELGLFEDVYITSSYIAREFKEGEVKRLREVADEVMRVIGQTLN
ncbi:hypothetical protein L3N51_02215 [Metallosphaera sp. J1]|uniref:HEPN domain-containing protein n=1 Tax=Metallosphaera javensis (ex Hofmann et al. 2022) TaxID=99938 RepID=UPI001EDC9A6D|nr:HEPN domain-containing protein [Metallosphaera javensis (ex Hofmann et al. 2022)]MCG3109918.1 hypothetical protein [Metallosphaera javensis (ex Hofmann et al. 2022)]